MDIIIALANDKINNYAELRLTLRSIDKNFSGYGDIYLIGSHIPSWVHNIIHIKQEDIFNRKQLSIYKKFLSAANTESVSPDFLRWDDDVYLLEPLHSSQIKDWHEGTLDEWAKKNVNLMYGNAIRNTLKIFPDGLYYDVHAPRKFNKERYKELERYEPHRKEILTKSTYFNHVGGDPVYMKDPKTERGLFYATNKLGSNDIKWLRQMFPNPSRYEAGYNPNS